MVVEARDLAGVAQGYESDDDDLLPLDATEPMPDGDDEAALSDPDVDPAASTAAVDGSEEPQALTEETWQQRESELAAQRERDLAQLRSIKDRETQQAQTLSMHAQAREKVLWQTFENVLTAIQNGESDADPRILYKLRHDLDQVQRTQMAQQQQQVQQGDSWVQRQVAGHQAAMTEQSKDEQGRQLFNPNDPDIARAFDAHIRGGTQQTWDAYNRAIYVKREAGLKALLTKDRTRANAAKAKARGVQSTGRGGGAAPLNKDAAWDQAMKQFPTDLTKRALHYEKLITQHRLTE
jgi:hypothetical protein